MPLNAKIKICVKS